MQIFAKNEVGGQRPYAKTIIQGMRHDYLLPYFINVHDRNMKLFILTGITMVGLLTVEK